LDINEDVIDKILFEDDAFHFSRFFLFGDIPVSSVILVYCDVALVLVGLGLGVDVFDEILNNG
jgi:hypothetical protein